jgi:hypothetical protein
LVAAYGLVASDSYSQPKKEKYTKTLVRDVLLILFVVQSAVFSQRVENYSLCFCACTLSNDSQSYMGLRSFKQGGKPWYLVVNVNDLSTRIIPQSDAKCAPGPLAVMRGIFTGSPYVEALDTAEKSDSLYQDAGLTHVYLRRQHRKGIDLTADLCPSRRPLDRAFFSGLIGQFEAHEKPVPIAIAVTGNWMYEHREDLQWLVDLQKNGDLDITWINHTYNHRTARNVAIKQNFLLEKGTNLDFEVLKTEQKMIEYGLTPSVFFRFPGLVSDSLVFTKVTNYGLIPVGSDAWLAKNQQPGDGSIVLVHANGNEPYGIKRFFKLIREERDSINAGAWLLYDLRQSIAREK